MNFIHFKNLIVLFFLFCSVAITAQNDYKSKVAKLKQTYDWVFERYEGEIIPVKKNEKFGYVKLSNFQEMIPCMLDFRAAFPFRENVAIVEDKDGKRGFIDTTGKLIIPFQFKYTAAFNEGVCYVKDSDGKNYFIDKTGKKLFGINESYNEFFTDGVYLHPTNLGNYVYEFQYLDKTGKPITPKKYKNARPFQNGLACVSTDGVHFGYINTKAETVIPEIYQGCAFEFNRPFVLEKNNKYFFYDTDATLINQDSTIQSVYHFKDDYFVVRKQDGKYGILNKNQQYAVLPTLKNLVKTNHYYCTENGVFDFLHQKIQEIPKDWRLGDNGEVLKLEKDDKNRQLFTFIDTKGKISEKIFLYLGNFYKNKSVIAQDTFKKFGIITIDNSIVLPFEYDKIAENKEGEPAYYAIKKAKKQGVITAKGQEVIPTNYDTLFYSNFYSAFIVKKNNLSGLIDFEGKTVLPIEFDFLSPNLNGLAQKNEKLGFLDNKGNEKIAFEYNNIDFAEDKRWLNLEKDGRYGLADTKTLKIIVPAIFDYCELKSNETVIGNLGNQKQIFSFKGKQLTGFFDKITALPLTGSSFTGFMIEKSKKFGILDNDCNTVLPLEFDKIKSIKNKFYIATKNNKEYFYQKDGKTLYEGDVEKILNSDEETLLIVKAKNKVGLLEIEELAGIGENQIFEEINTRLRLQYEYDEIEQIKETPLFYKVIKDKKIGIYSKYEKKIIIATEYDKIESIDEKGRIVLKKKEQLETYLLLFNGKASRQN